MTEERDPERLERLKFRLSLIATVADKLLIATFLAILGFILSRELQQQKASLDQQIQQTAKAQQRGIDELRATQAKELAVLQTAQATQLETLRGGQQAQLEAIRGSQQVQIEGFKAGQNRQIEGIRGEQSKHLEILRGALAVRSNLSERRITAYEQAYVGAVTLARELDMIATHATPEQAPRARSDALITFRTLWQRSRLFLSEHATDKVDGFIEGVDWPKLETGDAETAKRFRVELEQTLKRLRSDLHEQFRREERLVSGGGA